MGKGKMTESTRKLHEETQAQSGAAPFLDCAGDTKAGEVMGPRSVLGFCPVSGKGVFFYALPSLWGELLREKRDQAEYTAAHGLAGLHTRAVGVEWACRRLEKPYWHLTC